MLQIKLAEHGNIAGVERAYYLSLLLQGLRIAVPAALLLAIPANLFNMPWLDA